MLLQALAALQTEVPVCTLVPCDGSDFLITLIEYIFTVRPMSVLFVSLRCLVCCDALLPSELLIVSSLFTFGHEAASC
jgi:hypothetical protein